MKRRFTQLDVFASGPLSGNALAVVVDGDGLDDAQMAAFARWTQLSETTFLLPPTDAEADYRVRIFTPGAELPFAGHPTLGSAYAWLAAGGKPRRSGTVVQQCGVGRVEVRQDGDRLAFAAPPMASEPVEPALLVMVCEALGVDPEAVLDARWLDNGPRWLGLRLDSSRTVLALAPDATALKALGAGVGVIGAQPAGSDSAFEVRFFAASIGVDEDPVTGSLNASLAQWLVGEGLAKPPYTVAQGTRLQRAGRIYISGNDAAQLWIGGAVTPVIAGLVTL